MQLNGKRRIPDHIRRTLLTALILFFSWVTPVKIRAADPSIVDVRRNIQLSDQDPIYKDYYIHAGPEVGLKPTQVVKVVRRVPVRDSSGIQAFGELNVEVGRLKIIFVQDNIAVAREYELFSRDELPMLEQTGILIGDRIDPRGSFLDNKKKTARKPMREEATPLIGAANQ